MREAGLREVALRSVADDEPLVDLNDLDMPVALLWRHLGTASS